MHTKRFFRWVSLGFLGSLVVALLGFSAGELTPEQEKGRRIYLEGIGSTDVPIKALMSGIEVPASVVPCVNCHGKDGKGVKGGAPAADISATALGTSATVKVLESRERAAYVPKTLTRAIGMGIDASDHELDASMPRYQMSLEDMSNLQAFLAVLGTTEN